MIKVIIKGNKFINEISILGHAMYDEYGKDIVCASVSSMVITTINALLRIDEKSIKYKSNDGIIIEVLKHDDIIDKLLSNLVDLLQDLEKQYSKNIEIRRC